MIQVMRQRAGPAPAGSPAAHGSTVAKGDPAERARWLERLVDAHGDDVLRLAFLYLRDRTQAEDLFQEVFLRAYTHADSFRGEAHPRTWLYRITINLCRDRLRSAGFRRLVVIGDDAVASLLPPVSNTEEEALAEFDREELLGAVLRLPPEFREVILLYYINEMDVREVAAALDLTEGTVKSRLHRARLKLRSMLQEGGFTRGG